MLRVIVNKHLNCKLLHKEYTYICTSYHTKSDIYGHIADARKDLTTKKSKIPDNIKERSHLIRYIEAFREYGYKKANLDPLKLEKIEYVSELDAVKFGVAMDDSTVYNTSGLLSDQDDKTETIEELTKRLESIYCGPITAQFMHITDPEEREWFSERYEQVIKEEITDDCRKSAAKLMLKSEAFDHFMGNKFGGVKRYGGEGAESCMPFYNELFKIATESRIKDVIVCTAHRGRLNLLTCLLKFPPVLMFRKMSGKAEFPSTYKGYGDVLSHLVSSVDLPYDDASVHVCMLPNASHLEAVNPVAMGKARGKEQTRASGSYSRDEQKVNAVQPGDDVLVLQIHGDAAFSGQGIVPETLALSDLPHYTIGGSIHLIINNQIGYTTEANRGRSSLHCSDAGQVNGHPIIHVNADHPEAVIKACRIAMDYRQKYRRDVIVNFVCFRKWGHNELDEPSFTQPLMYKAIRARRSIPEMYAEQMKEKGIITEDEIKEDLEQWKNTLNENLKQVDNYSPEKPHLKGDWSTMSDPSDTIATWDTGYDLATLRYIGAQSVKSGDASVHSTLVKTHFDRRLKMMGTGQKLDWATCESLAFGSLLYDGYNVRISGQDVGRGTFSQRHAMIVDQNTDTPRIPLNDMKPNQTGFIEIANSPLSEEAVLGFEYGMSIENSNRLCIWEAQFGDFFNGAQIIIDTCITGGEIKWLLQSGLTMLLPHGLDGAGPEHSSCRIERFLQMTDSRETEVDGDDVNMQVAYPTTPAQYFHLLRRQMVRNYRKPLLICGPKTLLRLPACVSEINELAPGTSFLPVINDDSVKNDKVKKVVFVSGKHFYTLNDHRAANQQHKDVAIIRIESLCPFPAEEIRNSLNRYSNATEFIWSQEEHRNQGSWSFINPRFTNVVGTQLKYVGRDIFATPAVGVGMIHKEQNALLLSDTFQ